MTTENHNEVWATFSGPIDNNSVQKFFQSFASATANKVDTVHLLIHSLGGYVNDGLCLYNYLKSLPINIVAYNVGNVSSIAVIIFLAANKRICTSNATFMIHKSHSSPAQGQTSTNLKAIADSLDIDNIRTESILKEHLIIPEEKWLLHERGDLVITANEAVAFNIAHEIGQFAPPKYTTVYNI